MPPRRRSRRYCAGPRHYHFTERMNERMSTALPGGSTSQGRLLPTSWFRTWWPSGASSTPAPQNLEQPILPGWILGSVVHIDEHNSAAPEVEAAVLREQSYGRQLGQIMDALQVLIDERGEAGRVRNPYIDKFTAMKRDIDHIKAQTAAARVQQLGTDLAILKNQDRAQYDRLRAEILHQLGE
jgi:hypothetical protein